MTGKRLTGSRTIGEKQLFPAVCRPRNESGNNERSRMELAKTEDEHEIACKKLESRQGRKD